MPIAVRIAALLLLLGLLPGVACQSDPEARDEPEYESSTLAVPQIAPIPPPFLQETLAIVPFVNRSLARHEAIGEVAPDLLAELAIEAGWRVVEGRSGQLAELERELEFSQSGAVAPAQAARVGAMLGARYVLVGAVTNFRITKVRAKGGWDFFGFFGRSKNHQVLTFDCQVAGRVVETETRQVVGARTEAVKKRYEVRGQKIEVLGVRVEDGETITIEHDTMGKVLKLAFANMLNGISAQLNLEPAAPPAPALLTPPPAPELR